jgi:twitching motility protein PilT
MAAIDEYLQLMVDEGGSDLHLKVGLPPKIRIHGHLQSLEVAPLTPYAMEELLKQICPPARWEEYVQSWDLDFAYEIPGCARFRSNYLANHQGMAAVFRVIPQKILSLDELKAPDVLRKICGFGSGLVLVTGPTGSGKSTTMAAMIDYINTNFEKHVITIEDPIEFVHQNKTSVIIHREVGEHSESFEDALMGAMRADPDIVLVGEMRELETIKLALNCAAMGMLVFGTLHTSNAPKTIDRVIDVFPADEQPQIRALLGECLEGVVSQLLCRTADGKGRVAVHEILLSTTSLPATIREGRISAIRSIIEGGGAEGMATMDANLRNLLADGRITPLEAYMKASDKKAFHKFLPSQTILG